MRTHEFPLDGPVELHVRLGSGTVAVAAVDGTDTARVELAANGRADDLLAQTTVELSGRTLTVASPRQGGIFELFHRGGEGDLDLSVVVPTGTPVKISTFTAPIRLSGRLGEADLAVGTSEVTVEEIEGDLRLRCGKGSIRAGSISGSVQFRSGAGSAEFDEIGQTLNAGYGSGDLRVRASRGAVRARCGSGAVVLGAIHGNVDVLSGSGNVDIGLPAGVSARLDVSSGTGLVRSELPVEDAPRAGGAAVTVRARTGSGNVRLFRAA